MGLGKTTTKQIDKMVDELREKGVLGNDMMMALMVTNLSLIAIRMGDLIDRLDLIHDVLIQREM